MLGWGLTAACASAGMAPFVLLFLALAACLVRREMMSALS